jgi:ADP-heptose:LPS heptosyltransferase
MDRIVVACDDEHGFIPGHLGEQIEKCRQFLRAPAMGGIAGEGDGIDIRGQLCDARKKFARFTTPQRLHMKLRHRCRCKPQMKIGELKQLHSGWPEMYHGCAWMCIGVHLWLLFCFLMLRRNVLIFQTGGLGDFVLTWPFAVALGRIYSQSRIIYVTHHQKGDLAKRVLRLEATDIEMGWHGLFAEEGKLPPAAMTFLESAHAIYSFLPVDAIWHQNIERINPQAKRVEIDAKINADYSGHLTNKILDSLQNYPPEKAATEQILRSISDRGIGFKPQGGTDVVMHPGSGSPTKCWPLESYVELAGQFQASGRSVRFVIGEVEREKWPQADIEKLKSVGSVRSCVSYLDLLNEISTAGYFIGNDSGPAHLAGIIGVETTVLFGPTNPNQWKPLGPRVAVISGSAMQEIQVDRVIKGLK